MLSATIYKLTSLFGAPYIPKNDMVAVLRMIKSFEDNHSQLTFLFTTNADGWISQCVEIPAIITGGTRTQSASEVDCLIKDAIFTAFGIPSYLADQRLLMNSDEYLEHLKNNADKASGQIKFGLDVGLWAVQT